MADEIKRITLTSEWQLLGAAGRNFEIYNAESLFDFTKTSNGTAPTATANFVTIGGGVTVVPVTLSSQSGRSLYVRKTSLGPSAIADAASSLAWDYTDGN